MSEETNMKLWLLRPVEDLPDGEDPWEPWYDKAFGFVVRAATEKEAREMAHAEGGDENRGVFSGKKIANTTSPWLDPKYSTCERLIQDGEIGVLMSDYKSA